ncbi:hypothetical protein TcCL_NonESM12527 [Trypanosoma cruzi]|uniref:Uncharacterized protein n=1 Tax=Trypanosoma cruzi (strain CL Brener) TaxID=353153 RepID=Q4E5X6_TRYCC|nr:hypothetical protein Tc00.1047053508221.76 [Trypanosoma cruzi]EAO00152.1 hypothetical protein Tc00.1047053508221.76 [Trypanosoma cruzi]RNC38241.1 hypothetical protein TcCL_NonESM12527 [Trypanosoma cruzi]|eukprot:XP_822003.1 hypothetical protein [Trypanosoma cruzi strain CL Brener]
MSTRLLLRSIRRQRRSGSRRDAPTDREKLLSAAGTEAARRTASRTRVRLPVMTLLLLLVPVRCFFCLPLLPPCQHSMDCGLDGVALRGDCASSCVARAQHWISNRKTSISMGAVLHMHVLCQLRLTFI